MLNCAGRDELLARLTRGYPDAVPLAARCMRSTIPPSVAKSMRNARLQLLAQHLRSILPGATPHRIARILTIAGRSLSDGGRNLASNSAFDGMQEAERKWLAVEIGTVLSWMPPNSKGDRWPRLRQMESIVAK
jgi:hypothetical protein